MPNNMKITSTERRIISTLSSPLFHPRQIVLKSEQRRCHLFNLKIGTISRILQCFVYRNRFVAQLDSFRLYIVIGVIVGKCILSIELHHLDLAGFSLYFGSMA